MRPSKSVVRGLLAIMLLVYLCVFARLHSRSTTLSLEDTLGGDFLSAPQQLIKTKSVPKKKPGMPKVPKASEVHNKIANTGFSKDTNGLNNVQSIERQKPQGKPDNKQNVKTPSNALIAGPVQRTSHNMSIDVQSNRNHNPKAIEMTTGLGDMQNVSRNNETTSKPVSGQKQLLQVKLDYAHASTGRSYQGDLWELSDYAPQWMKGEMDYSFLNEKISIVD
jgi:hypothetical protein